MAGTLIAARIVYVQANHGTQQTEQTSDEPADSQSPDEGVERTILDDGTNAATT